MTTSHRVALVTALAVVAAGGWTFLGPPSQPDQPLPPADATVVTVGTAYLQAAVRQDCAFTEALTMSRTFSWCTAPTMTTFRNLAGPTHFTKEQAGQDQQCMSFEMTNTESSDGSLTAGDRPWSLCFVSTNEGWRLYDQGFT